MRSKAFLLMTRIVPWQPCETHISGQSALIKKYFSNEVHLRGRHLCDNHAHSGPSTGQIGKEMEKLLSKMLVLVSLTVDRAPIPAVFDPEIHFTRALVRCTRTTKLHVRSKLLTGSVSPVRRWGGMLLNRTSPGQTRPMSAPVYPWCVFDSS